MRNKKFLATIATLTLGGATAMGLAFTGCHTHSHTYSEDWKYDELGHWHYATCDDLDEKDAAYMSGYAEHVFGDDDECDICHYVRETTPEPVTEYTVTLDVNGGTLASGTSTTVTTVDGKIASLPTPTAPAGKTFEGWYTAKTNGTKITSSYEFKANTTIYAVYADEAVTPPTPTVEYTITLNVGDGALGSGVSTTVKAVDGKISGYLPEPTSNNDHWRFDNWYDAAEGGNAIDETKHVFEADTTLYARYVREDGVWNSDGSEYIATIVRNNGCEDHPQYWLDGKTITLNEGDEVSLYLGGKLMTYTVYQSSTCIQVPASSEKVTSVTVSKNAMFVLYLNEYGEDDWQVEYTGTPLEIEYTNKIPEGCDLIEITVGNGIVKLYIVAPDGTAINAENASNYQVHAWAGPTNIFGEWNDNPTLDGDISVENDIDPTVNWMLHWSGGQSSAFSGIVPDNEFVVKLALSGDCYVKMYDPEAPDEEEGDPEVDTRDFYILGAGKSTALNNWGIGPKLTHAEGTNVYTITLDLYEGDQFQFAINSSWASQKGVSSLETKEYNGTAYLGGESNITCVIEGNYTFTLTTNNVDDTGVITWTYNGEVEEVLEETVRHYYIKGSKVTNNWQELKTDAYELKETEEGSGVYTMTIELQAGDEFMFYSTEVGVDTGTVTAGTAMIQSGALKDGVTCVTVKGSNLLTTGAGTYTFTYENGKLNVTAELDAVTPDEDNDGDENLGGDEDNDGENGGSDEGNSEE